MVYYKRNSNRRIIDREPPRRDYNSRQQTYYGPESYHHAPSAKPTSRVARRSNFHDYYFDQKDYGRDNDDNFFGDYRRNYRPPVPNPRLRRNLANVAPKSLNRRSFLAVRSYNTYKSSSSRIIRPNYCIERDRNHAIAPRRYNQKQTFRPFNYIDNRGGNIYQGRKMQHRKIKTYYKQFPNRMPTAFAADKQHSPLPPPPSLLENEVMMVVSSPCCSEEGELMRRCSPVLERSPGLSSPCYSEEGELKSCSPILECLKF